MTGLAKFVDLETIRENRGRSWSVPSSRDPSVVYRVEETSPDHFSCTCPNYVYRRSGTDFSECKHCVAVRVKIIADKRKPQTRKREPFAGEFSF
jgi:hypothetical protein